MCLREVPSVSRDRTLKTVELIEKNNSKLLPRYFFCNKLNTIPIRKVIIELNLKNRLTSSKYYDCR